MNNKIFDIIFSERQREKDKGDNFNKNHFDKRAFNDNDFNNMGLNVFNKTPTSTSRRAGTSTFHGQRRRGEPGELQLGLGT